MVSVGFAVGFRLGFRWTPAGAAPVGATRAHLHLALDVIAMDDEVLVPPGRQARGDHVIELGARYRSDRQPPTIVESPATRDDAASFYLGRIDVDPQPRTERRGRGTHYRRGAHEGDRHSGVPHTR